MLPALAMPSRRSGSPLPVRVTVAACRPPSIRRAYRLLDVGKRPGIRTAEIVRVGGGALLNQIQPIGVRIRQRTQQHTVDDAEDCGVRPDAERQRQERGGGDAGGAKKKTDAVADILQDGCEYRESLPIGVLHRSLCVGSETGGQECPELAGPVAGVVACPARPGLG